MKNMAIAHRVRARLIAIGIQNNHNTCMSQYCTSSTALWPTRSVIRSRVCVAVNMYGSTIMTLLR
jgi:hypothetical protein